MTHGLTSISEEAKLYLTQWGHGNEERFVDLFRKVWNRVPATKRFWLIRYWGHQGYAHDLVCGASHPAGTGSSSPRIELVGGWDDRDTIVPAKDRKCRQLPAGEIFACGYLLRFCAPCIDLMPADVVQDVIAHELARCWQYADSVVNRTFRHWDLTELEREAGELMRSWGFNPEAEVRWFTQANPVPSPFHRSRGDLLSATPAAVNPAVAG